MPTVFSRTREQLSRLVLRKLAVAGASDVSADMDIVYEAIDLRLKEMHRLGIFWRKVTTVPISFAVAASSATASAGVGDILFPIKMTIKNGSLDDPVDIIDIRTFAAIKDKDYTGIPQKALWDRSAGFVFWPIPLTATTAKLVYEKIADDTAAGTAPDIDVSMLRWLKDVIAYDLSDEFVKDEGKIQRWRQDAILAEKNIRKLNALSVDYTPVAVDNFDDRPANPTGRTDYGWYQ